MLQTLLRRRTNRDEEGFTLIELMVVVLIIAILLAIAIPTFLGARSKAQARGAQSNLRNALTAEKTVFTDNSQYSSDAAAGGVLATAEPSLKWNAATAALGQIGVTVTSTNGTNDAVQLVAMDASSAKCWYIFDETVAPALPATGTPSGTYYAFDTHSGAGACAALPVPTGTPGPGPAATASTWYTNW